MRAIPMNMDRPRRWLVLPVMLLVAVALGLLALLLVKANPAEGALPGDNGRIVFVSSGEIYTMMPDGTDIKQLTSNAAADGQPAWSPDGTQIAFTSNRDAIRAGEIQIYKMDADGTNQIRLTTDSPLYDRRVRPAWSPNGDQIAFSTDGSDGTLDVFVMDPNGNNVRDLTEDSEVFGFGADSAPAWSPDGTQIAYSSDRDGYYEIYKMHADGTNPTRLTFNAGALGQVAFYPVFDGHPAWSPDGTQIAFTTNNRDQDGNSTDEIYKMDANGSDQSRIATNPIYGSEPGWSPDGTQIAFESASGIYKMDASGSNLTYVAGGTSPAGACRRHPRHPI
jgi:Tol biopolymer transport system component